MAQFTTSTSGDLVYLSGPANVQISTSDDLDLAVFDRKGASRPLNLKPGSYRSPRVSPDGKFVAFEVEDTKEANVWLYELRGRSAMRLLTFGGKSRHPVWSPDSQWLTFQSDREGDLAIFRQRADGSGTAERLTKAAADTIHDPQSWSPDGAVLLFSVQRGQEWSLLTLSAKDRQVTPFGDVRSIDLVEGAFSPDGHWVAYQAHETASRRQVFLLPFPHTGSKYLVADGGHPYWSPRGDQLILNVGPSRSVIVPVSTTPQVAFGTPVEFPRVRRSEGNPAVSRRNADSMPDGEHIV